MWSSSSGQAMSGRSQWRDGVRCGESPSSSSSTICAGLSRSGTRTTRCGRRRPTVSSRSVFGWHPRRRSRRTLWRRKSVSSVLRRTCSRTTRTRRSTRFRTTIALPSRSAGPEVVLPELRIGAGVIAPTAPGSTRPGGALGTESSREEGAPAVVEQMVTSHISRRSTSGSAQSSEQVQR